ncbi:MAG: RdgB/HAM1 family non-canonical purine NTP pyrophosphatase [Candidatus Eisenbacteria bacterium]
MAARWILATANGHKVGEIAAILAAAGSQVELVPLPPGVTLPEETGNTFLANARLKARAVVAATGQVALADDSGLEVDALGGDPGVHSARYAGDGADDEANNAKLLAALEGIHGPNRRARFRCVLVLARPDGAEVVAQGAIEGFILPALRGGAGFGYDPLFQPEGDARSLAEYPPDEKNRVSHRGQAVRQLLALLTARGGLEP